YFDVTALGGKDITVNSFDIHCSATTTVNAEVWYTIGTYVGNTNTPAVWTKLGITQTVAGQGIYNQTSFNPGATLTIPSGSTYGFYINCYSGNTGYLVFSGGSSSVSNSDVSIYSNNVAWNVSVGTGSYSNYCFNGTVYYSYITQGNLPFWDLEITKSNATVTTNGDLIIGNDLIVKPGASLTNLANTITAAGNVLLEADNTGTASFIQSTPGFSAKAEQYLTQTNFHYISAPVSNQNISTEFVNTSSNPLPSIVDFYKFDEPNNLWRNIKNASGNLNTSFETGFVVDRGYVIAYSDNSYTRTYNGFLNYSDQTVNMTKTTASGSAGWNLVGNPFPATIAANSGTNNFISDNTSVLDNTHTAVYLWNGSGYNTVNLASTATYISPGQGFFVKAANNNSTLAINTAIQKHSSSTFYKTSGIPRFTIRVQGPSGDYNETEIVFIEGTSKGLDPGYDAQKLMGNSNIALYTILVDDDGGYYAIQSLPPSIGDQNVKLGLDAWQTGLYEFDSIQIENLQNTSIYLEDKTQNTFIDLNINPTYSFSIPVTGSFQDRFELHFGSIITESEEFQAEGNTITIFSDGNKILIQNIGNHDFYGNIAIYNLAGQKLYIREISISANSSISLSANLSAGLYLLHFISDEISITEKIILK
ncbi:MAG: T9SS type A sorting domain-containing protein, partial [Bacteroidota bacterium]|nr:T9SS type A sorting domain-containing protein [Bacteroidota bacterium]